MRGSPRNLIAFTFAVAIVVAVIALLATESWVAFAVVLVVHALGTAIVLAMVGRSLRQEDKPDPVTEAAMQEGAVDGSRRSDEPQFGIPERR